MTTTSSPTPSCTASRLDEQKCRAALVIGFSIFAWSGAAGDASYSARPLAGFRAAQPPIIDGKLDDAIWKLAPKSTTFIDTITEQPADEQTDAWIAYDDKAIYVAFYCHDSRPKEIVARDIRHGGTMRGDDTFTFLIDAYYNRTNDLSTFMVNPLGNQREIISGGRAAKREWSGVWKSAVRRVEDGWTGEMRIPWEVLPYPHGKHGLKMGINFSRYHARTQIRSFWSNYTRTDRPELIGIWSPIDTPDGKRANPLRLLTYASGEYDGAHSDGRPRAGVDVRYAPSAELNSVLSILPDFRNVEQSVEGIQFSRTERYLSESRPFFQEGSNYFPGAFYSRRISDFDEGAKVYGRLGQSATYGLLAMARGDREADTVGQAGYTFGERGSASLYGLLGRGGRPQNEQAGMTWSTREGHWYQSGELNRARTGSSGGSELGTRMGFGDGRWQVDLGYGDTSPGYSPALGFAPLTDIRSWFLDGGYSLESRHGPLRSYGFGLSGEYSTHYSGKPFIRSVGGDISIRTRTNYLFSLSKGLTDFDGAEDDVYSLRVVGTINNRYRRWVLGYQWGKLDDHRSSYWSLGLTRRLLRRLDVGLSASIRSDIEHRNQMIGTLGWEFDSRRSLTGRVVETDGKINWYLAFRNSGGLGHEIYLILGDPNAMRFQNRIALKWVWGG